MFGILCREPGSTAAIQRAASGSTPGAAFFHPLPQVRIRLKVSRSGSISSNYVKQLSQLAYGFTERNLHQAPIVERGGETGDLMLSVKADSRAHGLQPPPRSKYYFHIASEFAVHTDDNGVVLSDLATAHRYAVSAIWNYMRCDTEEQDWRGWHVKIADDTGRTLVIVLFPTASRKACDAHGASG